MHQGVIDGGNQSGIPWVRGFERFDDRFIGKPLVFCGTVGRIPREVGGPPSERKEVAPGDVMVMVGGRIGKDGIHGATFSSEELRTESPAQAVQIGDPITQRKMYEFLMEARDLGLYRAITDNGAGGLSSSVGEMASSAGAWNSIWPRRPLKYEGLQPWEIFLSEAQERMSLAVPPENAGGVPGPGRTARCGSHRAGHLHRRSGALILRYGDRMVGRLDMDFLHDGCPGMDLEARWTPPDIPAPDADAGRTTERGPARDCWARLNVCSSEYKSRMYDGEVKGLSVLKPFVGIHSDVPSDATVLLVGPRFRRGRGAGRWHQPVLLRSRHLSHDGQRDR